MKQPITFRITYTYWEEVGLSHRVILTGGKIEVDELQSIQAPGHTPGHGVSIVAERADTGEFAYGKCRCGRRIVNRRGKHAPK